MNSGFSCDWACRNYCYSVDGRAQGGIGALLLAARYFTAVGAGPLPALAAAHLLFIAAASLALPAGVRPPFFFASAGCFLVVGALAFLILAHLALAAAASFARCAAEKFPVFLVVVFAADVTATAARVEADPLKSAAISASRDAIFSAM